MQILICKNKNVFLLFRNLEEYRCLSGQCIDITLICDGTSDCNDGSDETSELCKSRVYVFIGI